MLWCYGNISCRPKSGTTAWYIGQVVVINPLCFSMHVSNPFVRAIMFPVGVAPGAFLFVPNRTARHRRFCSIAYAVDESAPQTYGYTKLQCYTVAIP